MAWEVVAGATVFVYDFDKFVPADLLKMMEKYRVTSFCAPPTVFRFLIREDIAGYDLSALTRCPMPGLQRNRFENNCRNTKYFAYLCGRIVTITSSENRPR